MLPNPCWIQQVGPASSFVKHNAGMHICACGKSNSSHVLARGWDRSNASHSLIGCPRAQCLQREQRLFWSSKLNWIMLLASSLHSACSLNLRPPPPPSFCPLIFFLSLPHPPLPPHTHSSLLQYPLSMAMVEKSLFWSHYDLRQHIRHTYAADVLI